jgi:hypothetical protein
LPRSTNREAESSVEFRAHDEPTVAFGSLSPVTPSLHSLGHCFRQTRAFEKSYSIHNDCNINWMVGERIEIQCNSAAGVFGEFTVSANDTTSINNQGPRSRTLSHFFRKFDYLKQALESRHFWPRYCSEHIEWTRVDEYAGSIYIAYPMVCFCDIPLTRIVRHSERYGHYGIGMTKDWATRNRLNPVVYVSDDTPVLRSIQGMIAATLLDTTFRLRNTLLPLIAYTKPTWGKEPGDTDERKHEFYIECEWRYVPMDCEWNKFYNERPWLYSNEFNNPLMLEAANDLTENICPLTFEYDDIEFIFVSTDNDEDLFVGFAQEQLAGNARLLTRVVSLQRLLANA